LSAAEDTELTEAAAVFLRRYTEAREFGFCEVDARLFAGSGMDVGELRRLRAAGCSPRLAAKILRPDP
jgi:hypothetical protein